MTAPTPERRLASSQPSARLHRPSHATRTGGTLTWLGHSCARISLDDVVVVTDPVLRRRIFHLRRTEPVEPGELRGVDVVLISHVHHDHLDLPSLDRVDLAAQVLVPAGAGALLRRRGFRIVREVRPGDEVDLGSVRVRTTQARHPAARRMGTGRAFPVGYVVVGTRTVYFAGDTDLFPEMDALGDIDVALLPIAGWGSRLPPGHLDPVRAVQALELIRPRVAVPIHWGTYAAWRPPRGDAPATAFADLAANVTPAVDVRVLRPGQSCPLD